MLCISQMDMASAPTPVSETQTRSHRILASIDLSAFTDVCLPYAISLARALESDLTLVHVMQPRHAHDTNALDWEIARQQARAHLERLEHEAAQALGRPVDIRLEQGHPAERIVEVARELHATNESPANSWLSPPWKIARTPARS